MNLALTKSSDAEVLLKISNAADNRRATHGEIDELLSIFTNNFIERWRRLLVRVLAIVVFVVVYYVVRVVIVETTSEGSRSGSGNNALLECLCLH